MVDSGSTGNFVSSTFVSLNNLPTQAVANPHNVHLADGSEYSCTDRVKLRLSAGMLREVIHFNVIPLQGYDLILGLPWLVKHNPAIDWARRSIEIDGSPLPVSSDTPSSPSLQLISAVGMKHAIRSASDSFLLLIQEVFSEATKPQDPRVDSILEKFKDVFPEDLPSGLPLQRDVDHKIELSPAPLLRRAQRIG